MRPIQVVTTLEDLVTSLPSTFVREGSILDDRDNQTTCEVFQQWILLLVDLGYLTPEFLKRDVKRIWPDIVSTDLLTTLGTFAELSHLIRLGKVKGFKALCSSISLHLYGIFREDVARLREGDVIAARRLLQAFAYCNRLTLNHIDLSQQCIEDYLRIESEIDDSWLPKSLTNSLNRIVRRWFRYWELTEDPKHGPKGVAGHGRTDLETKYRDLSSDQLIDYAFKEKVEFLPYQVIRSTCDRLTQTIFVPKSYKTFRTISMESVTTMFYQQAVWTSIDRYVNKYRYLRDRIGFHEQERNKKLARLGSLDRNYATIDLSAASDSVSYILTKAVFRRTPLLRYIVATRSPKTLLPDGRVIELKKFAPMGSAMCFPIETIIFASICEHVTREHGFFGDYSVVGDDIIVPTECVDDVIYCLTILGFHVNQSKSFVASDCWFRESCGGEYMDGFDVTPMFISRKYDHKVIDIKAAKLVDMANSAGERDFLCLRSFLIKKLSSIRLTSNDESSPEKRGIPRNKKGKRKKNERKFIPYFAPTSLVSGNYSNFHTKRRWSTSLHRIETYVTTIQSKHKQRNDDVAYYHWLKSNLTRKEVFEPFVSNTSGFSVSILDKWKEKPYDYLDEDFIWFFTSPLVSEQNAFRK